MDHGKSNFVNLINWLLDIVILLISQELGVALQPAEACLPLSQNFLL